MLPSINRNVLSMTGRKRVSGQRNKTESEALTFEIESYITPDLCLYKKYGLHVL